MNVKVFEKRQPWPAQNAIKAFGWRCPWPAQDTTKQLDWGNHGLNKMLSKHVDGGAYGLNNRKQEFGWRVKRSTKNLREDSNQAPPKFKSTALHLCHEQSEHKESETLANDLTNSMKPRVLQKLTVPQLAKTLLLLYRTPEFIPIFTTASTILSQINPL